MGVENRPGFPDKKLFNKHPLSLELFNCLDKIQNKEVRNVLEISVDKLNTVLMRIVERVDQKASANLQAEEAIALIDSLGAQVDELKKGSTKTIYLDYIKQYANTKILSYVRKSVKP